MLAKASLIDTLPLKSCETHKPTTAHMEIPLRKKLADWHRSKSLHFHKHGDFSDRRQGSINCTKNNNNKKTKNPNSYRQGPVIRIGRLMVQGTAGD